MNLKNILLTFLLTGFIQNLFAYPITPRPLRKLIEESESIVVAYVLRSENVKNEDTWSGTRAVLIVREVLQGNVTSDTVHVYYTPFMICPAPAHYQDSTMCWYSWINVRKVMGILPTHFLMARRHWMKRE